MEKFLQNLQEAEKIIQTVDHIIYITFPLFKDKKLLLRVLSEIKKAVSNCINSVLQYEYLFKRIKLYKDPKINLQTFTGKCAPRYNINKKEIGLIIQLFEIVEKHKDSPFEFIKDGKVIILSNEMEPETISVEKSKEFLVMAKEILAKVKETIKVK